MYQHQGIGFGQPVNLGWGFVGFPRIVDPSMYMVPQDVQREKKCLAVTASFDQTIKVWDPALQHLYGTIPFQESQVNAMSFTADGIQMGVAAFQRIRIYDMHTLSPTPIIANENFVRNVTCIGFEKDGSFMYLGGEDQHCRIFDMRGAQLNCGESMKFSTPVNSVDIHPNQIQLFVADSSGNLYVWDMRTNKQALPCPEATDIQKQRFGANKALAPEEFFVKVSAHPNGRMVAGITNKGQLVQWDFTNAERVEFNNPELRRSELDPPQRSVAYPREVQKASRGHGLSCRYSPRFNEGHRLVTTSSDNKILIWDPESNRRKYPIIEVKKVSTWIWDTAFTADGAYFLAGGSTGAVSLFRVRDGNTLTNFEAHTKPITALCAYDYSR